MLQGCDRTSPVNGAVVSGLNQHRAPLALADLLTIHSPPRRVSHAAFLTSVASGGYNKYFQYDEFMIILSVSSVLL